MNGGDTYVFNIKYTFEIEKFDDRPSGSRPPRSGVPAGHQMLEMKFQ